MTDTPKKKIYTREPLKKKNSTKDPPKKKNVQGTSSRKKFCEQKFYPPPQIITGPSQAKPNKAECLVFQYLIISKAP